ncbi:MAG: DUF2953 domain-containing protein [Clostridia bacterium]|nr:DUF2953 domain-containing protein [Clostridia bacterium]
MIALYIIGGIVLLLLLLLIIPVSADTMYKDKFTVSVIYGGIKVFDSSKPKKQKPQKPQISESNQEKPTAEEKQKKENFITKIFNEKGKIEGIKFLVALIKLAVSRIIWMLKKIKFRQFLLNISIASDNAANTAISYGAVCAAVYPTINLLDQNTDLSVKKVNIYTDFDKLSPEIETAISVKTRLIYAVIALISMLFAYLKLKKESDKNGR